MVKIVIYIYGFMYRFFPFCGLRTAKILSKFSQRNKVQISLKIFGYIINLKIYRSLIHFMLYFEGEHFVEDVIFLDTHVKKNMAFFDIGANIGYLTYFLCNQVGPRGKVFSFEPDPENYEELSGNIRANDIAFCHLFQTAVGSFDGKVPFSYGFNGSVDASADGRPNCGIVSLDSFVREHSIPRVDFVKIDVEGYEVEVLEGMSQILENERRPILYLEVHPLDFCGKGEPAKVCSFLESYYTNMECYRPLSEVRSELSPWEKLLLQISSKEEIRRKCRVTLKDIKENQQFRYYLLCLP